VAYEVTASGGGSGGGSVADGLKNAPLSLVLTTATPLAHVLRSRTLRVSVDEVPKPTPNPHPDANPSPHPNPIEPYDTLALKNPNPNPNQAAPPPSFREEMATAIEAEQRAIAAADAAQQRASSYSSRTASTAVVIHESGELSRARREVPSVPVVPPLLSGAAAAARRLDGGSAQGRAVTGGDGVTRRAVL